jgi:hypothetical protein
MRYISVPLKHHMVIIQTNLDNNQEDVLILIFNPIVVF